MISPARVEAYRILYRVETERAYASHLLSAPQLKALSNEDRGLAYEIVMGVLRWQRRLDFLIERGLNQKISLVYTTNGAEIPEKAFAIWNKFWEK